MTVAELLNINTEELVHAGKFEGICSISNDLYHASPGLSFSGLKKFAQTPAHYQAYKREEYAPSGPQRVGTLVHGLTLEPETFEKTIRVVSKCTGAAVEEGKKEGFFVVNQSDLDTARRCADAVMSDEYCRSLLTEGQAEQSVFWRDPVTGLLLKCRPDYLRDNGVIVDVKTFGSDLSDEAIMKQVMKMKYHWQSALYCDGVSHLMQKPVRFFIHIFVSSEDPYLVRPILLNDASLDKARSEYQPLLEYFLNCERSGQWPGYPRPDTGVTELTLPDWAW